MIPMTEKEIGELLDNALIGRLAMSAQDATPYVIPLPFRRCPGCSRPITSARRAACPCRIMSAKTACGARIFSTTTARYSGKAQQICIATISEIKISPSIILVIHHPQKSSLPLTLYDVDTGEVIGQFCQFIVRAKRIDFVEQFGEYLLLKQEGCNLRIINVPLFSLSWDHALTLFS